MPVFRPQYFGPAVVTSAPVPVAEPPQQSQYAVPSQEAIGNYAALASNLPDDASKYQAAVDLARTTLQDQKDVSDGVFKEAIDTYYDKFNPEKSGREMRGENAWTDMVGGARDVINGFNTGIGTAIDAVGDTLIGGAMDLAGAKKGAENFRNLFTGEDLALIPDIATDVALTATGVGIPAMIAKNAIQLSPQMAQGISGKDAITLEEMDGGQQAANAALGFGGLALAAIPGIGKGVNIAKASSDTLAKKGFKEATEELASKESALNEAVQKGVDTSTSQGQKIVEDAVDKVIDDVGTMKQKLQSDIREARKADPSLTMMDAYTNLKPNAEKAYTQNIMDVANKMNADAVAADLGIKDAEEAVDTAQKFLDMSRGERIADILKQDATGLARGFAAIPETVKETRTSLKNAKDARKISREANEESKLARGSNAKLKKLGITQDMIDEAGKVPELSQALDDAIDAMKQSGGTFKDPEVKAAHEALKSASAAKKKVDPNADLVKAAEIEESPAEAFRRIVGDRAKQEGIDVDEYARESLGIDNLDKLPVKGGTMMEGHRARVRQKELMQDELEKQGSGGSIKGFSKDDRNKLYEEALTQIRNESKLSPRGFKGYSPLGTMRRYYSDAMDTIMRNANAGAGVTNDLGFLNQAIREETLKGMRGIKGGAGRVGNASLPWLSRIGNTAGGMVSGVAAVPLAEMAVSGGTLDDALDNIAKRIENGDVGAWSALPMLLTGSKGLSKRVNPGLTGTVGRSSIPHNALRSLGSAERWAREDDEVDTGSRGFGYALDDVIRKLEEGSK